MRNQDVEKVYELVELGSTVLISNGLYGPFGYLFNRLTNICLIRNLKGI